MLKTEEINEQYSLPQRQAPVGVIIEIIYAFQKFIRRFWPLLIVIVVRLKTFGLLYSSLIIILILIAIVVFGYLNYKNFLFHINEKDEEFILEKGIFDKKRIAIKLSRIQQVNINQSFFQKFIDVYEVEIETAGSTKKEVKINAVSKENAFKMRNILLTETQYKKEKDEVVIKKEITESNLIKISPNSLLKVAVTSDYFKSLWLVAIFLFASYNRLKEIFFNDKESESKVFDYFSKLNIEHYVIIIIASIIILVFIFNLLKTFIIYYDYKIGLKGNSLQFSYGLINNKNTLIQPAKVQKVTKIQNFFQRKMKIERMNISQASSNIGKDKKATIHIPGLSENEAIKILNILYGKEPEYGTIIKPTVFRVFSSFYKFILVPIIIGLIVSFINSEWIIFLISLPVYLIISSALIYISYQNNKLSIHNNFIIKQSGIWDIKTSVITPEKIQSITTKQYLWQIKSDIGHVTLHTAGGDLIFKFGNFSTINNYTNLWLYQVETSNKEWM